MLAFSNKENATKYGSTLEEDSLVMALNLIDGDQIEQ